MEVNQTITAISTAMNNSGIGIIRISGDDAFDIISKIFKPMNSTKNIIEVNSHTVHYGNIVDGEDVIDEVLVLIMKAPHTYTRENTVEIDCHGGVFVVKKILELVLKSGARVAQPGEFTKRAFLNGRIDLSQAEAVIGIINAQNDFALKSSLKQLKGTVSEKLKEMRKEIIGQIAFIEAALDDPEHIEVTGYGNKLLPRVKEIKDEVTKLIETADDGRILSEGINTVILGKPNVGKSSFLNVLLGEERAIVTDIAGTTRDALEERIRIGDICLNIIDTAGIRQTKDVIEEIGVKKAKDYAREADLILYIVDGTRPLDKDDEEIIEFIREKKAIVLLNKVDLKQVVNKEDLEKKTGNNVVQISAKENIGIEEFSILIRKMFYEGEISFNDQVYITNARHKTALLQAQESLIRVEESIKQDLPEDFFSIDLTDAYEAMGIVLGEAIEDDLVNEIFDKFCMGK